jgi:hypothetical protein
MKFWKTSVGRYVNSVAIGLDQMVQVVMSPIMSGKVGDPDETISSRLGRMKLKYGGRIPWWRPLSKIIDLGLDKIDPNHSIDAIGH